MMIRAATMVALVLLGGCGLQLAEREALPESLRQVRLQLPANAREFAPKLRDALRDRGVELVEAAGGDAVRLVIHSLVIEDRLLSVSSVGTPIETEVSLTVVFSLMDDEGELFADERVVLTRDLTWDQTRVLAKEREEELLRAALEEEAARRIVARYARAGG